jgi:spore maturation protein CgeB
MNRLVTGVERKNLLNLAASHYETHLFTQKNTDGLENVKIHGGIDYYREMPEVFRNTKINLNITLRSITSGVPLRVFDILGAGGFCLTNFQEGIREHFMDGEDLVMYTSAEDMLEKIQYYLKHEEERKKIAKQGHETVKKYSYENTLGKMLE